MFSFNRNATYVGYYNDQILFRGLYPFLPHTMLRDFDCMLQNGIRNFMSLQTGGQVFQPDYNLLLHAEMVWNDHLTAADFIRSLAAKVAGKKYARVLSDYLIRRMRVYEKAMIWCELDADVCHLDYRWLKEDSSPFFRRLVKVYGNAEKKLRSAASKLSEAIRGMPSGLPLAEWLRKESSRAVFEAEVFHVMKLQQDVFSDLPEARRTRDAEKVRACRRKLVELGRALADSVKTGEAAGQREAYYGKFADPWMRQDLNRKIAWCDSILKKQPVQGFEK